MKTYSALCVFAVLVSAVTFGVFGYQGDSHVQATKSVEFNIAEPSDGGMGLAMPASGNSGRTTDIPACDLTVVDPEIENGEYLELRWEHFAASSTDPATPVTQIYSGGNLARIANLDKYDDLYSFGGSGWKPVGYSYTGSVYGASCIGYCSVTNDDCGPDNFGEMLGVIDVVNSGIGETVSQGIVERSNLLARVSRFMNPVPVAEASSRSRTYTCKGATAASGSTRVKTGYDGLQSGVFMVAMATRYEDEYGGHHEDYAHSACFSYVTIAAPEIPEVVANIESVPPVVAASGVDLVVNGTVRNIGTVATNDKTGPGIADGRIYYEFTFDTNSDGSIDYQVNNESTIATDPSGEPMLPNTVRDLSVTLPAALFNNQGRHTVKLCVNDPQAKRRFNEIEYSNNCYSRSFDTTLPDLGAYAAVRKAIIGDTAFVLDGIAMNTGTVPVANTFNNQFEVRRAGTAGPIEVLAGSAITINQADRYGLSYSNPFNPSALFPGETNLEYRFWVDSPVSVVTELFDNTIGNESGGNNDSEWRGLTLVKPDVYPESQVVTRRFDTDVPIVFPFRIHNKKPYDMTTTFTSIAVIDTNGDCRDDIQTATDTCVDFRTSAIETTSLVASGYDAVNFAWQTKFPGTYRVKVFADNTGRLEEDNENDNRSAWITFCVSKSLDDGSCGTPPPPCNDNDSDPLNNCQDVEITAEPTVIRKGADVVLEWDVGERNLNNCQILANDTTQLVAPLSSSPGFMTVNPMQFTQYKLYCTADGPYEHSQDTVDVHVLPTIYES